ncbi:MAG: TatD family hydrolase [Faecalibacterium sp.]
MDFATSHFPIFDTHSHYTASAFDDDRIALLESLPAKGVVGVCEQATGMADAKETLALAHQFPWVYAAMGIHPESLTPAEDCGEWGPSPTIAVYKGDWQAELNDLCDLMANDPKVVAIGECGLDYHWPVPKDAQNAMFEAHIKLALALDKPLIVHDREAHADVYALLKKYKPKGIIHCYSGSAEDALWLAAQGMYIGFGGACTFKGAKRACKAVAALPLEHIVLETDCPYMTPVPHRGKRNDSSYIAHVGEKIAEIKGISPAEVFTVTTANAYDVFRLNQP